MTKTELFLLMLAALAVLALAWLALRSISDQAGIDDLVDETENELK